MKNTSEYLVVIGASAGGYAALKDVVVQLDKTVDAAYMIVMHLIGATTGGYLAQYLQKHTLLECSTGKENEKISKGHIYVAPLNQHMLVKNSRIILGNGPVENRWRPSIDALFRSGAVDYGEKTIGIILTGMLDDGTAGLIAVKKCGGTTMVQSPNEAEYPDMPLSALSLITPDYTIPIAEMGETISRIIATKVILDIPVPPEVTAEAELSERVSTSIEATERLGEQSVYSYPACGGSLWEINEGKLHRYRCHVGHSFYDDELMLQKTKNLESTLWVAMRIMEERTNLLTKLANEEKDRGLLRISELKFDKIKEMKEHVDRLKEILFQSKDDVDE